MPFNHALPRTISMNHTKLIHSLASLLLVFFFSIGCDKKAEQSDSPQNAPSSTAKQDTLTFAFQPQENPAGLELNTKAFADFMAEKTGYEVEIFLPTNYASVVEALRNSHADVAYFSGWPYLVAHKRANAELLVAEERSGNSYYYSHWYVAKDSDIQTVEDLRGRAIAFTSPSSTSGYLFPLAHIVENGLLKTGQDPKDFFGEVLFAGGYQQALVALANGQVEAAAASDYALTRYLSEEQQKNVRILTKQGPIPTHGIAIRGDLPDELKQQVRAALLELNKPENSDLLKSIYGAEKLVEKTHDEHVKSLDEAAQKVGLEYPL